MLDIVRQRLKLYRQQNPNELTPQQFQMIERELKQTRAQTMSDECHDFRLWCLGYPSRQELFANYLEKRLPKGEDVRILEVGCGRTGRLSRILSEKGFMMTGIDPKLEVKSSANIEFIKGKFDYREFNLSDYDFVIAQEPCDATEHIVRACLAQNVPFIMSLCGSPHRLISGEMHKDVYYWWDYLANIDTNKISFRCLDLDPLSKTPILKSRF